MIIMAELNGALPHVLAAPKTDAPIRGLCLRPALGQRAFVERIRMTKAQGIPGERWMTTPWMRLADGSPDPRIQVSILQSRVLDLVWQDRTQPHPGDPIVADLEMSEANLPVGSLIKAGTAVLRVSDLWNDSCAKWKVRYGKDAYDWVRASPSLRLRGILCSVVDEIDPGALLTLSLRDPALIGRAKAWRTKVEQAIAARLDVSAKAKETAALIFAAWQGRMLWGAGGGKGFRLGDAIKRLS